MLTPELLNDRGAACLPGLLGMRVVAVRPGECQVELAVVPALMAPNGFLHAASVVALADTAAGYGCMATLPEGARGFTTLELKSNHLGTAREGTVACTARAAHRGRTTQVWDAEVVHRDTGRTLALFRCTQILLYPEAGA